MFQRCTEGFFYQKAIEILLETFVKGQSFEVNVQLGYDLIDRVEGTVRYYDPRNNTSVFPQKSPAPINQNSDIETRVLNYIRGSYRLEQLRIYKDSKEQVKSISSTFLFITVTINLVTMLSFHYH